MSSNLQDALAYAERGWFVFPVQPYRPGVVIGSDEYKAAKRPVTWLVPNGHLDASTNEDVIREWWAKVPRARIGLDCKRSGILVIDHDDYKANAAQLPPLPDTWTAKTPQDGRHYFFARPAGDWTDTRTTGLDTKGNGYVVLPSSDAGGYEWLDSKVMDPAALTPELRDALLKPEDPGPGPQTVAEVEHREAFLVEEIGLRELGGYRVKGEDAKGRVVVELERCPFDSAGHSAPYKAVIGIGSKGEPFAMCVVAGCAGRGWRDLPAPDYGRIEWEEITQPYDEDAGPRTWNGAELALADLPPIDFLPVFGCDGYVPTGFATLLASEPKCGKTTLIRSLVLEWVTAGKTVLFLTEESERLWKMRLDGEPEDWRGLTLLPAFGWSAEDMLERIRLADEDVIIVDTGRSVIRWADENDNAGVERTVRPWIQASRARGKTFIVLHHARKGGGEHGEQIAGAHALFGLFDQALVLQRDRISSAAKKAGERIDQRLRWIQGWGRFGTVQTMAYGLDSTGELKLERGRVPKWDDV